jgi:hypothetical protein
MKHLKTIGLLFLSVISLMACAPSQNGRGINHATDDFAKDFAQRSDVGITQCSQSTIDVYAREGDKVLCGGNNDGFELFASKNDKAATALGATKSTNWDQFNANSRTAFTRCYRWDLGIVVCVGYVLNRSVGGEVYISY